jgi:hypothetical protein
VSAWLNPVSISADSVVLGKFWGSTMTSPFSQDGLELRSGGTIPVFEVGTTGGVVENLDGEWADHEPVEPPRRSCSTAQRYGSMSTDSW